MSKRVDAPLCVECRRMPVDARWRPFCSERCKLRDLARWADGSYRVPGEEVEEFEESEKESEKEEGNS